MQAKDTDLASAADIGTLRLVLPLIETEVAVLKQAITIRAFTAIRSGEMTESLAQALWQEFYSIDQLGKRFQGRLKAAQAAGQRVAGQLTDGLGPR